MRVHWHDYSYLHLIAVEVLSVDDGGPFYAQVGSYVAFNCSFGCSVNYDTSWCAIWNYTVSKASLITCSNTPASWTDFSSKFNASTENDVTNSCWLVLRFVAEPELNNAMFACRRTLNVPVSGATNIYEYRLPRLLQQLKVSPSSTLSSLSTSINIKSSYSTGNPSGSSIRPSLSTVITSEYPSQSIMASITQMSSIPNLSGAPPTSILVVPSSSTSCGSLCTPAYGQLPSVSTAVSSTCKFLCKWLLLSPKMHMHAVECI